MGMGFMGQKNAKKGVAASTKGKKEGDSDSSSSGSSADDNYSDSSSSSDEETGHRKNKVAFKSPNKKYNISDRPSDAKHPLKNGGDSPKR